MLRTEPLKLNKTRLQGFDVKLAPEGEMAHLVLQLEQFEFEERIDRREKMVALRPDGVGRRTGQAGVGLDRLVEDLDAPPFLVDGRVNTGWWTGTLTGWASCKTKICIRFYATTSGHRRITGRKIPPVLYRDFFSWLSKRRGTKNVRRRSISPESRECFV